MDIGKIPFSMAGSWLAVSKLPASRETPAYEAGVYLRSVHGMNYMPGFTMLRSIPFFARMLPVMGNQAVDYNLEASTQEVVFKTACGSIGICFGNRHTLLLGGCGVGLQLEFAAGNFAQSFCWNGAEYLLMNCRTNDRKFALHCQKGSLSVQKFAGQDGRMQERVVCTPDEGRWLLVLEDAAADWLPCNVPFDYESCRADRKRELDVFAASLGSVSAEYEETAKMAAYVDWSCIVAKQGRLTRDAMLMSKNHMCNVWSWDHCFNAIALCEKNPEMAWDQFMLLFDYQDAMGALPDSVSDIYVARAFQKPPIHGWALSRMMEHMELGREQCREAYDKLDRWTMWWLNYRDSDGDGICEYAHGHDSGWDNATVFRTGNSVELPDLAAFLILQMETLAQLAGRLGMERERVRWEERAQKMLADMRKHCFKDGHPQCLIRTGHEEVRADSLILYLPLLLGKRLPKEIRDTMILDLKEKGFLTPYGFATEAVTSELYEPDGYWRGPIWAPPTLFLVEGLRECGEIRLAREVAERFCRMVKHSGFAENFDALTGKGLRDKAYTWTASIFLILAKGIGAWDQGK